MSVKAFLMPALRLSALVAAPMSFAFEAAAVSSQPHGHQTSLVASSGQNARCPASGVWTGQHPRPHSCLGHHRSFGSTKAAAFTLPQLPYPYDALSPYISAATLKVHHGKHHAAYISKLNGFIEGTSLASQTLEEIVKSSSGSIFNNAAQAWNHEFYFNSMKPASAGGGGQPVGRLREEIERTFGSFERFKDEFSKAAAGHFGSGWAWLVWDRQHRKAAVEQTHDAGSPLTNPNIVPLLCCDVWEHAYYLDRMNDRPAYIDGWWHVVNWEFADANLRKALE
ncbi:iron-containing superoxide dismutase [Cystoisospora suis]|uniref:Superoxide dismutase [Fe] n=1 Tax=Cystoisospora suis TaxID=483139 RepID=A0A2C6KZ31_9APIC|nr:iron-containing superoxide dismutase [Cystoisospora suis]